MSNPIICGRRVCAGPCGRWRHTVDFKWRWQKHGRTNGNRVRRAKRPTIDSVCQPCRRAEERKRYRALSEAERRAKGLRANQQAAARRAKAAVAVEMARLSIERRKHLFDDDELDLVPFRMWVLAKARELGSIQAVADVAGVEEKSMRRWAEGYEWNNGFVGGCLPTPIRSVRMSTVDEVGVAVGEQDLLNRLYPYVEDYDGQ
jgi:hypothetical protein